MPTEVEPKNDADALDELAAIAAAFRAHLEWHEMAGTTGLPRATPSVQQEVRAAPVSQPLHVAEGRLVEDHARPLAATSSLVRLTTLAEEVKRCSKCALHAGRTQTVFARGNPAAELCFVGEGPGADEDAQGVPFVGKAGQLLDRMIAAMNRRPEDVYICNIVKCRPPNNRKPEPAEMAACVDYLSEQLSLVSPRVIVALGATAVQGLFGTTEGITRLRGKWRLYKGKTPVMPTFHPAYLLRAPAAKREVWADLQEVMRTLDKPGGG